MDREKISDLLVRSFLHLEVYRSLKHLVGVGVRRPYLSFMSYCSLSPDTSGGALGENYHAFPRLRIIDIARRRPDIIDAALTGLHNCDTDPNTHAVCPEAEIRSLYDVDTPPQPREAVFVLYSHLLHWHSPLGSYNYKYSLDLVRTPALLSPLELLISSAGRQWLLRPLHGTSSFRLLGIQSTLPHFLPIAPNVISPVYHNQ
jgi:hypothetical protein